MCLPARQHVRCANTSKIDKVKVGRGVDMRPTSNFYLFMPAGTGVSRQREKAPRLVSVFDLPAALSFPLLSIHINLTVITAANAKLPNAVKAASAANAISENAILKTSSDILDFAAVVFLVFKVSWFLMALI